MCLSSIYLCRLCLSVIYILFYFFLSFLLLLPDVTQRKLHLLDHYNTQENELRISSTNFKSQQKFLTGLQCSSNKQTLNLSNKQTNNLLFGHEGFLGIFLVKRSYEKFDKFNYDGTCCSLVQEVIQEMMQTNKKIKTQKNLYSKLFSPSPIPPFFFLFKKNLNS